MEQRAKLAHYLLSTTRYLYPIIALLFFRFYAKIAFIIN